MHTNTQTHLYELLHISLPSPSLSLSLSPPVLFAHTHMHVTHSHQTQADGPSVRQAADPCPHSPNEHPLTLGGQNQNPNIANTTAPTATHYQPPACCDIPCALIVQHSYEPSNPSELTPKMRMTTFTTSPPTPRLYIQ